MIFKNPWKWSEIILSIAIVAGLACLAVFLTNIGNKPFGSKLIEFPIWAVAVGLAGNVILKLFGLKEKLNRFFNTEVYIKIGIVLLGASINVVNLAKFGSLGIIQALMMITSVFLFTWWLCRLFGLDKKLAATMSAAVSICGVSAAIAAAGSVLAKKEQLAYVVSLVILFALPLMILMPYLAVSVLHLSPIVAGAWIGGNIDTTAAVVGAGVMVGKETLEVASIVKMSQNALIGIIAFLLTLYWVLRVERKPDQKPNPKTIWQRFPKFILGFILMSILASSGLFHQEILKNIEWLRTFFLSMAFICIGLTFSFGGLKQIGWRPLAVFSLATIFNTVLALGVASLLFK